jgi:hypothetical protein
MEVVPLHAVIATGCFLVVAVLCHTEFLDLLPVLAPVHTLLIYALKELDKFIQGKAAKGWELFLLMTE